MRKKTILHLAEANHIPGIAIAVIRQGRLAEQYAAGMRNVELKLPVLENTIFEAASLSKPIFAYAMMKIVEQKILDLDRPLTSYLAYQDLAHDQRSELITARMVLSHRTGLINWRKENALNFVSSPGVQFSYSGEGYFYLQKVVEKLTNLTLQQFALKWVFNPLGMVDSSYLYEDRFEQRMAIGYDANGAPQIKNKSQPENCAFTLHTTAMDYAKFLLAMTNGFDLGRKSIEEMLLPGSYITPNLSWGLGWGLQNYRGKKAFFQWGDNGCFKCYAAGYPEENLGVVYFTNSFNGLLIAKHLLALTLRRKQPALEWLNQTFYK